MEASKKIKCVGCGDKNIKSGIHPYLCVEDSEIKINGKCAICGSVLGSNAKHFYLCSEHYIKGVDD